MTDTVYIALTLVFFALMVAYGHACRALGRVDPADQTEL